MSNRPTGMTPLTSGLLVLGETTPCAIYDAQGKLLLPQGSEIRSQRQIDTLVRTGYFTCPTELFTTTAANSLASSQKAPDLLKDYADQLAFFFTLISIDTPDAETLTGSLRQLVTRIQKWVNQNPGELLSSFSILDDQEYPVRHTLQMACLTELFMAHLGWPQNQRVSTLCAALTANLSMQSYQHRLNQKKARLPEHLRLAVEKHPLKTWNLLKQAGITDPLWLDAVVQHHERLDGSGYPAGLSGEAIHTEGRLLAITEVFSALISPKSYQPAISAEEALRVVKTQQEQQLDARLSQVFIQCLAPQARALSRPDTDDLSESGYAETRH